MWCGMKSQQPCIHKLEWNNGLAGLHYIGEVIIQKGCNPREHLCHQCVNVCHIYLDGHWYTWVARPNEVYVWKTLSKDITVTQDYDNSLCYCEHKKNFPTRANHYLKTRDGQTLTSEIANRDLWKKESHWLILRLECCDSQFCSQGRKQRTWNLIAGVWATVC